MTYIDLSDKNNYDILLSYILKQCDEISFHFPILDEEAYNINELAEDYKKYEHNKQELLAELFNYGATREIAKTYHGIRLGYETQIIKVKLYPKLIERIKRHHLYDWVWWNALPEDPCFFAKKECRFITISHEETFFVCDEKKDSSLLHKMRKSSGSF